MNLGGSVNENACASTNVSESYRVNNGKLEGKPCKLLHWIASGEVAYGEITWIDPTALVDEVLLGPDCYKVWLRGVLISNIALP
ncbi:hypothetical protein Scep_012181 [Stephania cephalantha]|uniref:Uncharacterized protein n=1 Tax=Stephania cephalantha TaxID=152367 RepID=A0AAP0P6H8_9MAGN